MARHIASKKIQPMLIPTFVSTQKWFLLSLGVDIQNNRIVRNGAIELFGKEYCDKAFNEELVRTGVYKEDSNGFQGISLNTNI